MNVSKFVTHCEIFFFLFLLLSHFNTQWSVCFYYCLPFVSVSTSCLPLLFLKVNGLTLEISYISKLFSSIDLHWKVPTWCHLNDHCIPTIITSCILYLVTDRSFTYSTVILFCDVLTQYISGSFNLCSKICNVTIHNRTLWNVSVTIFIVKTDVLIVWKI